MSNTDPLRPYLMADYMGAVAHFLGGRPERHEEFIEKVEILLSGNEPDAMQLMQLTGRVRSSGRPVIWIHHMEDAPGVPLIGLVAQAGDQTYTIENCVRWSSPTGRKVSLVPDNFRMESFEFDDGLRLLRLPKAPAASLRATRTGMVRAELMPVPWTPR